MGVTSIEWCDFTFNPWRGCTKVSPGCANCYAETMSHRNPAQLGVWGDNGTRVIASESYWKQPLKWNREAQKAGERRRVFCASLADVFEDRQELVETRYRLFDLINQTPDLDWLLLTKRPENVEPMFNDISNHFCWVDDMSVMNIWLGVSVENQEQADKRIPQLLKIPAAVRFLSCEPLLGPLDLFHDDEGCLRGVGVIESGGVTHSTPDSPPEGYNDSYSGIDWVIVGGESGPGARPMHPSWARSLLDQCVIADVAFHFKQWGEWTEEMFTDEHETVPDSKCFLFDDGVPMVRFGKKRTGRLLDDREWNEFPEVR
jgi:protein gp37